MWHRTIDCLGLAVGITSRAPEVDQHLAGIVGSYEEVPGPARLEYELELHPEPRLVRNGEVVATFTRAWDLIVAIEIDLYRQLVERTPGLQLHAAGVVGTNGRALVFAGRSGAGKSTLLRSLLAQGFRYLTEEMVALTRSGTVRGLARPLHIDDDSLPVPAGFAVNHYVIRDNGGEQITRVFLPPEHVIWRGEAHVRAIVNLDHAPDANDSLERLPGGPALEALWATMFRYGLAALDEAAAVLADTPMYRMRTTRPERALAHALALAEDLGVTAR